MKLYLKISPPPPSPAPTQSTTQSVTAIVGSAAHAGVSTGSSGLVIELQDSPESGTTNRERATVGANNQVPTIIGLSPPLATQPLQLDSFAFTYGQRIYSSGGVPQNYFAGLYVYLYRPGVGNVGELWSDGGGGVAWDPTLYEGTVNNFQYRRFTAGNASPAVVDCVAGDRIAVEFWFKKDGSPVGTDHIIFGGNDESQTVNVSLLWTLPAFNPDWYPSSFVTFTQQAFEPGGDVYLEGELVPPSPRLPLNFTAAVRSQGCKFMRWVEIEGIPYGYGTPEAQVAGFFAARAVDQRFLGIKNALLKVPPVEDQVLDTLEGAPSKSGQIEVFLGDFDGAPTLWTGVGNVSGAYVAVDLDETDTDLFYQGDGSAIGSSGTLYIGTETVTFTSHDTGAKKLSGLLRGRYRSKAQAFGVGYPIGLAPYTMSRRRVWYYIIAIEFYKQTFSLSETDKVLRFAGRLRNIRMGDKPGDYVLPIDSIEAELSQICFRALQQVTDTNQAGIADGAGAGGAVSLSGTPGYVANTFRSEETAAWVGPTDFAMRVDDEIFLCDLPSLGTVRINKRALCGTQVAAHSSGFVGREVAVITAGGTAAGYSADAEISYFTSAATSSSPAPADNPLMVILQLLLSSGAGTNWDGVGRNYDVLPINWGIAVDFDRVDVWGIEQLSVNYMSVRCAGVVDQPANFLDIVKSLLTPLGLYATSTLDGLFTIRELRPPLPEEDVRLIDNSARMRNTTPGYDSNLSAPVDSIQWSYAWDLKWKRYRHIQVQNIAEAVVYTQGQGRKLQYEMRLFYAGSEAIAGEPTASWSMDVEGLLLRRADFFRQRYARPPPVITERVDYSFVDIELGELVAITCSILPNPLLGTRGLVAASGEVISKKIDEIEKVIEFEVLLTGYQGGDWRYIAPSLEIDTVVNTSTFTVKANAFTRPIDGQNDLEMFDANRQPTHTFVAGQQVRIYSADFSAYSVVTILSVGRINFTVTLTGVPTHALAVGQFVTFDEYANNSAGDQATYAFLASNGGYLDAGNTIRGDKYFP